VAIFTVSYTGAVEESVGLVGLKVQDEYEGSGYEGGVPHCSVNEADAPPSGSIVSA
jgi:hypothetical protein